MAPKKSKKTPKGGTKATNDVQQDNAASNGDAVENNKSESDKVVKETGKKTKREATKNGPANNLTEEDASPTKKRKSAANLAEESRGSIKLRMRKPPPTPPTQKTSDKKAPANKSAKKTPPKKATKSKTPTKPSPKKTAQYEKKELE